MGQISTQEIKINFSNIYVTIMILKRELSARHWANHLIFISPYVYHMTCLYIRCYCSDFTGKNIDNDTETFF